MKPSTKSPILKTWVVYMITSSVTTLLFGMIAGGILGFMIGAICAVAKVPADAATVIRPACSAAGFIAGLCGSFLCFKWSVNKFLLPAALASTAGSDAVESSLE